MGGLGRISGEVGVKRGGSCRGGVGLDLPNGDGARYHYPGVGEMVTQRFKLYQLCPTNMDQNRCVGPGLQAAPCLGGCRSARRASGE